MFIEKLTKTGLAVALLGMGIFTGCSDDNSSMASTLSETNSGTPIAKVDTSLLRKDFYEGVPCGSLLEEDSPGASALARKSAFAYDDDEFIARPECGGTYRDILLYINSRVRVVDSDGNPMVGAKVYKDRCAYDDMGCQYVTDSDGYVYIDSVNFLTYWEKYEGALEEVGPEKAYARIYERLQLRAISADSNFGANVFSYFARAHVVMIDGEPVAELQKIVVEPVYSAKLYLDSIYLPEEDEWYHDRLNETIAEAGFGICVQVEDGILSRHYERDDLPYDFYPCQMVTEEDKKNGFVYVYGLPEGNYEFAIGSPNSQLGMGCFSLEVSRPAE
jgi:hypothetical protein